MVGGLVVEMVERIRPTTAQPRQVVAPQPAPAPVPAPIPASAPVPTPAPTSVPDRDGSSEEATVEVMDSGLVGAGHDLISKKRAEVKKTAPNLERERERERETE